MTGLIKILSGNSSFDPRLIRWKETFWHNGLRSVGAGFSWVIISMLLDVGMPYGAPMSEHISIFFSVAIGGVLGVWLLRLLALIPVAGIFFGFLAMIWLGVGDPWVYLLHKVKPEWVPMENPPFFSTSPFIFVLSPFSEY